MAKLKRSAHLLYIDATFGGASPSWFLIGKHVEDLSIELNPNTEITKNILDETSAVDNGYEPSADVDTYYADPSDGTFYEKMKDIAMNRKTGDDCRTKVLEVLVDSDAADASYDGYDGWTEDVLVKPTSYGGAQGGFRIPYTITFDGNRTQGKWDITNKVPKEHP
jgi:hypothetical protein